MRLRLRHLKDNVTGDAYIRNEENGVMYRRLVGGLAWPFDVAGGAMVLLAESRNPDFHTQRHNVYVLDEFQSDDITGLLRRMHRLQLDHGVRDWITPRASYYMEFMHAFNDEQEAMRQQILYAYSPPQWDRQECLRFYMRLLERRIGKEKTLHFGNAHKTRDQCVALAQSADVHHKRLEEFPGPAAMLYALAEVDLRPPTITLRGEREAGDQVAGY